MYSNQTKSKYFLLFQIIFLAVSYFIAGKLGSFLRIPPGYATVIFPPSGIALAGVLLCKNRHIWIGVLLGAFFLNGSHTVVANDLSENLNSAFIALIMSLGATLQAIFGAYLLKRFAGFPNWLAQEKEILLFLLYGGLVSALVNSTLSVSTLVITGAFAQADFLHNWITWWGGDVLGIFIFTPLILVCLQDNIAWDGRKDSIVFPVITVFMLTIIATFYEVKTSNERIMIEFKQHTTELNSVLEKSINSNLKVLHFLKSFYLASQSISENEFNLFATQSLNEFEGNELFEWAVVIKESERAAFEENAKKEGHQNFQITELDENKKMVRAGSRAEYVSIRFIAPFQENNIILGYNIDSNPLEREAMIMAKNTGKLAITAPMTLIQKQNERHIIAFLPAY